MIFAASRLLDYLSTRGFKILQEKDILVLKNLIIGYRYIWNSRARRKAKDSARDGKDLASSYQVFGVPGLYGGLTRSTDNDGVVASYPLA